MMNTTHSSNTNITDLLTTLISQIFLQREIMCLWRSLNGTTLFSLGFSPLLMKSGQIKLGKFS